MKTSILEKYSEYLFWLLLLIVLAPIWSFHYFPGTDGASHVGNAVVFRKLLTGECEILREFFRITPYPVPNYGSYALLGILTIFFEPVTAEKITVSLCIILTMLALRYLANSIKEKNTISVLPAFIFVHNGALYSGTYSFLISAGLALFACGWWLRSKDKLSKLSCLQLFFIVNTLYFCHLFGLAFFLLFIGSCEIADLIHNKKYKNIKLCLKSWFKIGICIAPSLLLFLWHSSSDKIKIEVGGYSFIEAIKYKFPYLTPSILVIDNDTIFQTDSTIFSNPFVIIFLAVCLVAWILPLRAMVRVISRKPRPSFQKHFYISYYALLLVIALIFMPQTFAGGWFIELRIQIILFFCLLIISINISKEQIRSILVLIYFGLLALQTISVFKLISSYQPTLEEFRESDGFISENSTLMGVDLTPYIKNYVNKQANVRALMPDPAGYLYANKCIAYVNNFHAAEKNVFPISYKNDLNPYEKLGTFRDSNATTFYPAKINIKKYEEQVGKKIDFIVVRGSEDFMKYNPEREIYDNIAIYNDVMKQISEGYDLVFTSKNKITRVYKRKAAN